LLKRTSQAVEFPEISAVNRGTTDRALVLKIGLHKGAAIAVTLNDRLDYFGQTVNIAARIQHLADANEIFLSEDIYASKGVSDLLTSSSVEATTAQLRGVDHDIPVFRIAPLGASEGRARPAGALALSITAACPYTGFDVLNWQILLKNDFGSHRSTPRLAKLTQGSHYQIGLVRGARAKDERTHR
jgi:Adenylate and Guanylate cyclase catalytic domain